jgi:hypothetical protein
MCESLPLVVGGSAAVNNAVSDRRLEWRRLPLIHGILRLDVIVAVDYHAPRGLSFRLSVYNWLAALVYKPGLQAQRFEMGHQPLGAGLCITIVLGLSADRRNSHQLLEFFDKTLFVCLNVGFNLVRHLGILS